MQKVIKAVKNWLKTNEVPVAPEHFIVYRGEFGLIKAKNTKMELVWIPAGWGTADKKVDGFWKITNGIETIGLDGVIKKMSHEQIDRYIAWQTE